MSVADNLSEIHENIKTLCLAAGRTQDAAQLVAVSKKQPDERIEEALLAGQRVFGENRVQEAVGRWREKRMQYPDLQLHLIGPLQTNKAKEAVALFDVIESVDREKLAKTIASEMHQQGRDLPCFIQVNTGAEEQKAGILPELLEDFYDYCYGECGLDIVGLMCIPPADDPPAVHFALLKKYADILGLKSLSMGMSADYEKAIPLGATHVRIGTGVFGERP